MNITATATDDVVTGTLGVCISGATNQELGRPGLNQFLVGEFGCLLFTADLARDQGLQYLGGFCTGVAVGNATAAAQSGLALSRSGGEWHRQFRQHRPEHLSADLQRADEKGATVALFEDFDARPFANGFEY